MNTDNSLDNQQVRAIISHLIKKGHKQGYEEWLKVIYADARQFPGL